MKSALRDYISEHYLDLSSKWITQLTLLDEKGEEVIDSIVDMVFPGVDNITKGMRRFVRSVTNNPHTLSHLLIATPLYRAKFSIDKLIQLHTLCKCDIPLDEAKSLRVKDITLLRRYYNDDRIFKLLTEAPLVSLRDTMDMMFNIYERRSDIKYLPKKPKSLTMVHDAAVRTLPKVSQENFPLNQREDVVLLDKKELTEGLVIRVPETHYDMIDLGEALSFCIGNGSYSRKVANSESSVIGLFENGKPRYGIEFSRYTILEAQGFGNLPQNRPPREVLLALLDLVVKKPELPADFLPITDSGWVHGYRYDNANLYLLLKDRVYMYHNVPTEVYEDLLLSNRKGGYVNRIIKPNYNCDFMGHVENVTVAE